MHTQHVNIHNILTCDMQCNMPYAGTTCLMQAQYACAKCMRTTATWHSPKIKVHDEPTRGFPSITFFNKTFEVAEKPSPLGNKYKGQMAEPLPACQTFARWLVFLCCNVISLQVSTANFACWLVLVSCNPQSLSSDFSAASLSHPLQPRFSLLGGFVSLLSRTFPL